MNTQTMERPKTEHAVITVQFANEKKGGQRNASIKDVDGLYYWIKPEDLHHYHPGETYEVEFITTQSNGYTNRTIKNAAPVERQPQRAQPAQAQRDPVRQSAPVEQPRQPQPGNGNGNNYSKATSPKDARRMFLCSQLNAVIASGRVDLNAQALANMITELSAAYDATIGREDPQE
jgi:hypothetical protein